MGVPSRHGSLSDAATLQQQIRARRQTEDLPDALLLLEHPPVYTRGRRSDDGELPLSGGLLPGARHRGDRDRPRWARHLPRPRPARRLSDHGSDRHRRAPAHDGIRDHRRARRRRHRGALARGGGSRLHRRVGRAAEDRLDRRARLARHRHPWVRGKRRQRPRPVLVGRRVRIAGCRNDVHRPRAGGSNPEQADYDSAAPPTNGASGVPCFRKRMAHAFCATHGRRQRLVSPGRLGIDAPIASPPARRVAVPA